MPAACLLSSGMESERLLAHASGLSGKKGFILLLNAGFDTKRLLPSYLNAHVRCEEGIARAGHEAMEMLLLAAGERDIRAAIMKCGIRNSGAFIVFATSRALLYAFRSSTGSRILKDYRLSLDPEISAGIAAYAIDAE